MPAETHSLALTHIPTPSPARTPTSAHTSIALPARTTTLAPAATLARHNYTPTPSCALTGALTPARTPARSPSRPLAPMRACAGPRRDEHARPRQARARAHPASLHQRGAPPPPPLPPSLPSPPS
eukprot:6200122-Pleurochrysis_carterae.AAC.1